MVELNGKNSVIANLKLKRKFYRTNLPLSFLLISWSRIGIGDF